MARAERLSEVAPPPDPAEDRLQSILDRVLQAIAAATGTASLILGAQDEIGTIEVGRLADLVILDADPLEDIRNTQRIWMVIQGGRVVDREALLTRGEENQ